MTTTTTSPTYFKRTNKMTDNNKNLIEAVAKAIYNQWVPMVDFRPWQDGGNSFKQDEARDIAREALAATPQPALAATQPLSDTWIAEFTKRGNEICTDDWTDEQMAEWVTRQVEAALNITIPRNPAPAPTQAQHLKAAAQQALTVLRGCLEHPDADDAISALQHAIAQPAKPEPMALEAMRERKNAAYLERNQVVAALAKCFPSCVSSTAIEGWSEDWHGCVYIDLPTGQVSWHFHDSHAHLFDSLPHHEITWDGHTTAKKYERLAALEATQPAKPDSVNDFEDTLKAVFAAGGYTGQFAMNHPKEKVSITFKRWLDEGNYKIAPTQAQPAAQEPVQVDAWQSIETAPKDKRIFLYWPKIFGGCIYGGQWERDTYAKKPVPYWTSDISRIVGLRELRAMPPTHWQPLPAPPNGITLKGPP